MFGKRQQLKFVLFVSVRISVMTWEQRHRTGGGKVERGDGWCHSAGDEKSVIISQSAASHRLPRGHYQPESVLVRI